MIIFLLKSLTSMKQLYALTMDVHARYRTEAHQLIKPRFNERFIMSLKSNDNCIFLDDKWGRSEKIIRELNPSVENSS